MMLKSSTFWTSLLILGMGSWPQAFPMVSVTCFMQRR
jgi:hypothetical protein